ncbi:MAG TPA: YdeI/OmpD-associated family protein [Bacteroidales bacterium]|nr:YdeI/OmpD-associated family protein [Bacteroidales bacterium]
MNNTIYFKDQLEFRKWLEENHESENEIIVGFYKKHTGKPSMTWSESVDQALCFAWIDGIRKSIDDESYTIRFTPRRPSGNWSNVNIRKVEELKKKGLMTKAGLDAYNNRKQTGVYSYENEPEKLGDDLLAMLRMNKKAFGFYEKLPPSYRKTSSRWIMSAKQEATKINRMKKLIEACENGKRLF